VTAVDLDRTSLSIPSVELDMDRQEAGSSTEEHMSVRARSLELIERLIKDSPKLHFISEADVAVGGEQAKRYGYHFSAGPISFGVPADVLRLFPRYVDSDSLTLETGCGHTTIALAALTKHHICISPDKISRGLVEQYMDAIGIPRHKVMFIEQSSEVALSTLSLDRKIDFAYVDGCHGYPFPALDWHFIDKHLRIGGHIGFDNVEVPTVRHHCDFMDVNQSYTLIRELVFGGPGDYQVNIYRKERDELREWVFQAFNEKKRLPPAMKSPPGIFERSMAKVLPWRLVQVPLRRWFGWPRQD
jgi:hypothetical protein